MTKQEHIEQLLQITGLTVEKRITFWTEGAELDAKEQKIVLYNQDLNVDNNVQYITILHEIGHWITLPNGGRGYRHKDGNNVVGVEVEAWKWAKMNSVEWTSDSQKNMEKMIYSYYNTAPGRSKIVDTNPNGYKWDNIMEYLNDDSVAQDKRFMEGI